MNSTRTRHVITIEHPIEYAFRPRRAFISQREVGRDTPSFEQAIIDALREDPDVLLIGEVRTRETMQLALMAAETGHLVMTTLHSSNSAEALQRIVSAFPAEIQESVSAQVADVLLAVVCQRLTFDDRRKIRVPECEVLYGTPAVKNLVRSRHFFKVRSALETGLKDDMWTYERWREWLGQRRDWYIPTRPGADAPESAPDVDPDALLADWYRDAEHAAPTATAGRAAPPPSDSPFGPTEASPPHPAAGAADGGRRDVIDIDVGEENVSDLLSEIRKPPKR